MRISLIAMDLDGTTLQADREHFLPRLRAALALAHERGGGGRACDRVAAFCQRG